MSETNSPRSSAPTAVPPSTGTPHAVLLEARGVEREYKGIRETLHILRGVDFAVRAGELVVITGASGSGKSTLLQILGTLDKPTRGNVFFEGKDLFSMSEADTARFRSRNLGFVFQFHHLMPEFTAIENVMMPGMIQRKSGRENAARARELLTEVGLADRAEHKPEELSGGEQQRVALARALFAKPRLVLADEPSGNLDPVSARKLHELMYTLARRHNQAWVVVTHNEELAKMADTRCRIKDGILEVDTTA